jgi:hypothetical protein
MNATETSAKTTEQKPRLDLISRILAVDLSIARDPLPPVKKGDNVIGVLSRNTQQLFCLRNDLFIEQDKLAADTRKVMAAQLAKHAEKILDGNTRAVYNKDIKERHERLRQMSKEIDLISAAMSAMVHLEFYDALSDGGILFIREGFQVILEELGEEELDPPFPSFLNAFISLRRGR